MLVSSDDQVKAYIKKIMSQLNKWMVGGKISKLVVVITSKETGEHVERWQFDVQLLGKSKSKSSRKAQDKENADPQQVQPRLALTSVLTVCTEKSQKKPKSKRPKHKSKKKSKPFFDKLQRQSRFFQYSMATAPSMYWYMQTQIRMCRLNGETVMQRRSRTARRCNCGVSARVITRSTRW
jgi:hypothetical protein